MVLKYWGMFTYIFCFLSYLFLFGSAESLLLQALFSSCSKQWLLSSCGVGFALQWLLLLQSTSSRALSFSSCSTQDQQLQVPSSRARTKQLWCSSMWNFPGPEIKPVSPSLAGRFFTTKPPGKPSSTFYIYFLHLGFCKAENLASTISSSSFFFSPFIFISWRLITLQCCSGFCYTLT